MEKQAGNVRGKDITIAPFIHQRLHREARELSISKKEYAEAALQFFLSRKLDPRSIKEGDTSKIVTHFSKGIDRVLAYLVTQERHVLQPMLQELVNTRLACEVLLSNLHKLSDLSPEEEEKLRSYNNEYVKQRRDLILRQYRNKRDTTTQGNEQTLSQKKPA
jgi:hypothetical protein